MLRRTHRVVRLLKAFITVDEYRPEDLTVRIGAYARDDLPEGPLPLCREHWAWQIGATRWELELPAYDYDPPGTRGPRRCAAAVSIRRPGCRIIELASTSGEKDRVEIWHRTEGMLRGYTIVPDVIWGQEDAELYVLLRDRGDDPDTARNTVLTAGDAQVDSLLANLRARSS